MIPEIQPILYQDPQTQPHRKCPCCGGEIYPPKYFCIRCGREIP